MTNLSLDWLSTTSLDRPWFLWLAYVAPHRPFHLPPTDLHTRRDLSGTDTDIRQNPRPYYLAAIEAMDTEIGRLLDGLPDTSQRDTIIIFIGDNGTPTQAVDLAVYARDHAKNTLYEGGVRVPMIVSGAGIARAGERESALVHTVDFFPTIAALAGAQAPTQLDGVSFASWLESSSARTAREFNYTEFVSDEVSGWAVRDARHKLLVFEDGRRELYDLSNDLAEQDNLIDTPELLDITNTLMNHGITQRVAR